LAKVGQHLNAPQLTKNAQRWMQNKAAYEQYLEKLEAEIDGDDYDEPAQAKPPKSNVIGQQNTQVDQIVNNVLSKLPSKIQGDIRNAIARAPNKLQALQAELAKRGVKAPMAEERMSAAVKLQRAWERERAKSDASRQRADQAKAEFEKEWKVKQEKEKGVAEQMMPASNFAGTPKNKLGSAGQLKGSMKRPARAGDLVGGAEESIEREEKQRLDPSCWKGYRKQGTKMKGGTRVNNCVKVSESVEDIMDSLINKIVVNEAISNNKR
jgi:hypothetical protein